MTDISDLITFNIFANCCMSSPRVILMENLLKSIDKNLNVDIEKIIINIYVDHHPFSERYDEYESNIRKLMDNLKIEKYNVFKTDGLSYSYRKSIENTTTPLLFQLEHDFIFLDTITHTLVELCNLMLRSEIKCLAFYRRRNYDLKTVTIDNCYFCLRAYPSNNPHILKIDEARERLKYIRFIKGSSRGIEYELNRTGLFTLNHVYGKENHKPTISHTDGRTNDHV